MSHLQLVKRGKVCDIYQSEHFPQVMFFNRTNRFSVGDKVFPGYVRDKGLILNQMSLRWMHLLKSAQIIDNHLVTSSADAMLQYGLDDSFEGTGVVAWKCIPIPIEAIVRGYYIPESKSWDPYKKTGVMYGYRLPVGMKESEKLPYPIYTPSTKAEYGEHDRNIDFVESVEVMKNFLVNTFSLRKINQETVENWARKLAVSISEYALKSYCFAHDYALKKGIIIADTKLEFGLVKESPNDNWQIVLIDEAFTPDSSRFWDASQYEVGKPQPSMDKQFIRRYVYNVLKWDGNSEAPKVKDEILDELSNIYGKIYERLFDENVASLACGIAWEWHNAVKDFEDYSENEP